MPRTALVIGGSSPAGTPAVTPVAADPVAFNSAANNGETLLSISNTGAVTHTLTVALTVTVDGQTAGPRSYSIPAGQTLLAGPFPTGWYGTTLLLNADSSELTLAALRPGAGLPAPTGGGGAATSSYTYTASTATIANPGRGFFQYSETHYQNDGSGYVPLSSSTLASTRTGGLARALVYRYFVMEKFLGVDALDNAWLSLVAADLAAVRTAGCKAVIRFTYSTSGATSSPPYNADPPVARVLGHISQLTATVNAAADVIEAVEAGFIGMWGEWYYTDNFGDKGTVTAQQGNDRLRVVAQMLDLWDPRIFVCVRYPGLKQGWFG